MIFINNSKSITIFQFILIAMTVIGLKNHVLIISPLIQTVDRDSWISVLVSLPIFMIWFLLLVYIHKKTNKLHLFQWLHHCVGSKFTLTLIFLVSIYLTFMAGITLRETITWVNITFLPKTPVFLLSILFTFVCWLLAGTSLRTISILNMFLLSLVVILGFFVSIANFQNKNYSLLLPVLTHGYKPIIKGIVYQGSGLIEIIFFLLMQHKIESQIRYKHFLIIGIILTCLTLGPLIGAITEFGPLEAKRQRFVSYEEWGLVSFGNFIEYVDFLSIYQWLSGAFIRIAFMVFLVKEFIPNKKIFLIPIFSIISITPLIPISDFTYSHILTFVFLPITFFFFLSFSILIAIIAALHKKHVEGK